MPNYKILTGDNSVALVDGRKFAHDIEGVRYWFFVHRGAVEGLIVSHLDSGMRVSAISHSTQAAHLGNQISAAKSTIQQLIDRVGAPRVRVILDSAPILKKGSA